MNDLLKNRTVLIGLVVLALGLVGGGIYYFLNQNSTSSATDDAVPVVSKKPKTTPGSDTTPTPGGPATPVKPQQTASGKPPANSWVDDPAGKVVAAPTPTGPGTGTQDDAQGLPAPPTPGGTGTPAAAKDKPSPIVVNTPPAPTSARNDPFVTFLRNVTLNPPAYSLVAPIRVASQPVFKLDPNKDATRQIGPLPVVNRRVSGIVTGTGVSAILSTGDPSSAETIVVQPGSLVPSYIPGIGDLTVESITSNSVTLRAPDKRSVTYKLSALPPGLAASLTPQTGNGAGGFPGGPGGGLQGGGGGKRGGGIPGGGQAD